MSAMAEPPIRVTVWNEYRHERDNADAIRVYPAGIHEALAAPLRRAGFTVRTATLDDPDQGLPQSLLDDTDILLWWGHRAHREVADETVDRVQARVPAGMPRACPNASTSRRRKCTANRSTFPPPTSW
jgi:trehalose utilization protein